MTLDGLDYTCHRCGRVGTFTDIYAGTEVCIGEKVRYSPKDRVFTHCLDCSIKVLDGLGLIPLSRKGVHLSGEHQGCIYCGMEDVPMRVDAGICWLKPFGSWSAGLPVCSVCMEERVLPVLREKVKE